MVIDKLGHPPPPAAYQDPSSPMTKHRQSISIFEMENNNNNNRIALKLEPLKSPSESLSPGILSPVSAVSINSFNGNLYNYVLSIYF